MRDRRGPKFKTHLDSPEQPRVGLAPLSSPFSTGFARNRAARSWPTRVPRARARERATARARTESDRTRRLDFKTSFRFTGSTLPLAARRRRVSLTSSVAYLLTALVGPLGFWNISEKFLLASPRTFSLQDRKSTRRSRTGGGAEMFREGERYKGKSTRKSRPQVRGFFFAIGQTLIDRAQDESERRGGVESVDLRWP